MLAAFLSLAMTVMTVSATVASPQDPLEVTKTEVTCWIWDSKTDICIVTDSLLWVETLQCTEHQCVVLDRYDLW